MSSNTGTIFRWTNVSCNHLKGNNGFHLCSNFRCTVSGWGRTSFDVTDAPTQLQKQVQVPIVSYTTCYNSMSNSSLLGSNVNTYLDAVGELCAGGQAARDACTVN